jgi:type I restriction enzyme S subunit
MNKLLQQVGIQDESYSLLKVSELIERKIIDKPMDGNHGEIHPKGEDFVESGIPFVMASDINNGHVDYKNCKFISKRQAESLRKGFAKNGDVLVTHKATIGRTAIVNYSEHEYIMLTPQVTYYRVVNHDVLNNLYLKYYFDSTLFQKTLSLWAGAGSTRAYLGITAQHNLPIIVPPIEKQIKIGSILKSYDLLIENNNSRIELLESMAKEVFHEWFIRFRFPNYQNSQFDKGKPTEWEFKPFSQCIELNPKESLNKDDLKSYVGMEALSTKLMYFNSSESRTGNSGSKFRNGDVLFPRITPCLENGKRGFVMSLNENEVALGSTEFIVFRAKDLTPEYIYFLSCYEPFRSHAENSMVGASGRQRVSESCFSFFLVSVPPKEVLSEFTKIVSPMFENIKLLMKQNENLIATRDSLLPRLISGKIDVDKLKIQAS